MATVSTIVLYRCLVPFHLLRSSYHYEPSFPQQPPLIQSHNLPFYNFHQSKSHRNTYTACIPLTLSFQFKAKRRKAPPKNAKDSSQSINRLFTLLGKRYRIIISRTNRLRDSFYPQTIRLLNTVPCESIRPP